MEGKHQARARREVEAVGEAGFDTGGLVGKRQRAGPARPAGGEALRVLGGLSFDTHQRGTFLFRLDDTGGPAIDLQEVIREPMARQRELADRHTARGVDVRVASVADEPPGLRQ